MKMPETGGKVTPKPSKPKPRGNFDGRGIAVNSKAGDVQPWGNSGETYNSVVKNLPKYKKAYDKWNGTGSKTLDPSADDTQNKASTYKNYLDQSWGVDDPINRLTHSIGSTIKYDPNKLVANPKDEARYESNLKRMKGAQKQYGQGIMAGQAKNKALTTAKSKVKGK
jgi:hypothetical protein